MNPAPIAHNQTVPPVIVDRISVCVSEPDLEAVAGTCGLLLNDKYANTIPGIKITKTARYRVSAKIPVPFDPTAYGRHPFFLEAGPLLPGMPSYRVDYNPAKISPEGLDEMAALIESVVHPTFLEFFALGKVTRVDAAVDLDGLTLDEVIVLKNGSRNMRSTATVMAHLRLSISARPGPHASQPTTRPLVTRRMACASNAG